MDLKPGHRVCFCRVDGVRKAEIYDGASKRLLGELDRPKNLTSRELEDFVKARAATNGLTARRAPYVGCNFYIVDP